MLTDVFGDAVRELLAKGDVKAVHTLAVEFGRLEYNLKHDVRMSGAHMAAECQGKTCEPYNEGE